MGVRGPGSLSFVHLHLHTQYSLLDGAIQTSPLIERAAKHQMPAVAITDHGNLFGALDFYQTAKKQGIKPIIGCEIYLTKGSRFEHATSRERDLQVSHLVLLAQSLEGYRNLCRIISCGFFEGFYYKPRVDRDLLRRYSEGLIALSGCIRGDVPTSLLRGKKAEALAQAREFAEIFPGRFFIELQRNGCRGMQTVEKELLALARELNLPLVATNDCHYMDQEDSAAHDVLLCIGAQRSIDDPHRMRFDSDELYFRSPDEMRAAFKDLPEACDNTLRIAEMCNLELPLGVYHFPRFEAPAGKTLESTMDEFAREGLQKKMPILLGRFAEAQRAAAEKSYRERLEIELGVIRNMGFAGYFLVVADFVNFARSRDIPVGPGRGSAAGSLVAYCLGITDLDPMPYHLLFERFLNPERISMPDIDMDFCIRGRDAVIGYVRQRYGAPEKPAAEGESECLRHQVAQIITFGKMQAKAVVRDVGRVLNMPYADVDRIAKLIPKVLNITLAEAIEQEPKLKTLMAEEARVGHLMELAQKLEGLARHASIHAAGVVMTDGPLTNFMPLYKGANGEIVTQFDMIDVEKMGLIKFDFLGLRTLTVIDDAVKIIRATVKPDFDIARIPLDDAKVYEDLSSGDTFGIFQLESSGMRELIAKLRPNTFEDLIALVALYRPGPLGSGMVDDFIKRKHGKASFEMDFPQLEPILKDTYGIIVYQEQVMQIAAILANYSLGEADILRRAMGKKKPEEMAKQKDRFLQGAAQNKIPARDAENMFELMAKFAEYGFNKSHSAAYALVSYQTAYLKTHHPEIFMAALLNSEKENTDKIFVYMHDCRTHGIKILPPDVNESELNFTVTGEKQIRFGLSAVKNIGEGAVQAILESRAQGGPFKDLVDFALRVDLKRVNRRVFESLIMCGAFDSSGRTRATLIANLDKVLKQAQAVIEQKSNPNFSLNFGASKSATPAIVLQDGEAWEPLHQLAQEKKALGFFITGHPLDFFQELLRRFATVTSSRLTSCRDDQEVRLAGVVKGYKKKINRRGSVFAFVDFEDREGVVEVVVFSELFEKAGALLDAEEPLFLIGTVDIGEESAKVIATDIIPIRDTAAKFASRVEIRLPTAVIQRERLDTLKGIFAQYRGRCPTFVRLVDDAKAEPAPALQPWEMLMSLPDAFRIDPSEQAVEAINRCFGQSVVHLL